MAHWGKAGQRLSDEEVAQRRREAGHRRLSREADDAEAYRLWRAGELKPYAITLALDANDLYGPEVDEACGAHEPDVGLWEAGKLYPTWEQVLALADLTGVTPRFLCTRERPLRRDETTLRFHADCDELPTVWAFPAEVVAATVGSPETRKTTNTVRETLQS